MEYDIGRHLHNLADEIAKEHGYPSFSAVQSPSEVNKIWGEAKSRRIEITGRWHYSGQVPDDEWLFATQDTDDESEEAR